MKRFLASASGNMVLMIAVAVVIYAVFVLLGLRDAVAGSFNVGMRGAINMNQVLGAAVVGGIAGALGSVIAGAVKKRLAPTQADDEATEDSGEK